MSSEWYTRPVTAEDVPLLGRVVWPGRTTEQIAQKIERMTRDVEHSRSLALVACHTSGLISYGQVTRWKQGAEIADLFVAETQRRQGIGSHMICQLRAHAAGWGVQYVEIGVAAANTGALRLYERLGFRAVYVRPDDSDHIHYLQWRVTSSADQTVTS
jgi:ribosomal-protein-alanine N-acetyltransferase